MIFIDSTIPMYLVGAAHPNKEAARRLLTSSIERGERLVTDAEVLQEILHRYAAIRRPEAVPPALAAVLGVIDEVFPVERADVERAAGVLLSHRGEVSARDALHVALMQRHGVSQVMSFDRGFDRFAGLTRLAGEARSILPRPRLRAVTHVRPARPPTARARWSWADDRLTSRAAPIGRVAQLVRARHS